MARRSNALALKRRALTQDPNVRRRPLREQRSVARLSSQEVEPHQGNDVVGEAQGVADVPKVFIVLIWRIHQAQVEPLARMYVKKVRAEPPVTLAQGLVSVVCDHVTSACPVCCRYQ